MRVHFILSAGTYIICDPAYFTCFDSPISFDYVPTILHKEKKFGYVFETAYGAGTYMLIDTAMNTFQNIESDYGHIGIFPISLVATLNNDAQKWIIMTAGVVVELSKKEVLKEIYPGNCMLGKYVINTCDKNTSTYIFWESNGKIGRVSRDFTFFLSLFLDYAKNHNISPEVISCAVDTENYEILTDKSL